MGGVGGVYVITPRPAISHTYHVSCLFTRGPTLRTVLLHGDGETARTNRWESLMSYGFQTQHISQLKNYGALWCCREAFPLRGRKLDWEILPQSLFFAFLPSFFLTCNFTWLFSRCFTPSDNSYQIQLKLSNLLWIIKRYTQVVSNIVKWYNFSLVASFSTSRPSQCNPHGYFLAFSFYPHLCFIFSLLYSANAREIHTRIFLTVY